jgi:hypothetical protein
LLAVVEQVLVLLLLTVLVAVAEQVEYFIAQVIGHQQVPKP